MQFSLPSFALVIALLHMLLKAMFRLIVIRPVQMLGIISLFLLLLFSTHPQYWQKLAADEAWQYQNARPGMVLVEQCRKEKAIFVEAPGGRDSRNCRNVEVPVSDQAEKSLKGMISLVKVLIILSFCLEFLLFFLGRSSLFVFPAWRSVSGHGRGGRL
ncbi:hypothetical protein CYD30_20735 [Kosakonia cowanii]|nr:hypothetical protein CYD30_20735 [Kosakonia cowanii]